LFQTLHAQINPVQRYKTNSQTQYASVFGCRTITIGEKCHMQSKVTVTPNSGHFFVEVCVIYPNGWL